MRAQHPVWSDRQVELECAYESLTDLVRRGQAPQSLLPPMQEAMRLALIEANPAPESPAPVEDDEWANLEEDPGTPVLTVNP